LCTDQGKSRHGRVTTRARTRVETKHTCVRPWSAHRRSPNPRACSLPRMVKSSARPPSRPCLQWPVALEQSLPQPRTLAALNHRSIGRESRAPPPAKPPELWPPRPAHPSHPSPTPAVRLASPETREASQTLRPSATSPETPDHPRWTSFAHQRAWTR
jgi:hypothetical protein